MNDMLFTAVGLTGALVLVCAGLAGRRLARDRLLKLAAIWVVIIGVAWVVATIGLHFTHAHFT